MPIQFALLDAPLMIPDNNGQPSVSHIGSTTIERYTWQQGQLAPLVAPDRYLFVMSDLKLSLLVTIVEGVPPTARFSFSFDVSLRWASSFARPYIQVQMPNEHPDYCPLLDSIGMPGIPHVTRSYTLPESPVLSNVPLDKIPSFKNPRFGFAECTWDRSD